MAIFVFSSVFCSSLGFSVTLVSLSVEFAFLSLGALSFTTLLLFGVLFFSVAFGFSTIVTDFSLLLSSIVLTLLRVGFSGAFSSGFSSILGARALRADLVNLGFSSAGLVALSACLAADGFTQLVSSMGTSSVFKPFSVFVSFIVDCFFSAAEIYKK